MVLEILTLKQKRCEFRRTIMLCVHFPVLYVCDFWPEILKETHLTQNVLMIFIIPNTLINTFFINFNDVTLLLSSIMFEMFLLS